MGTGEPRHCACCGTRLARDNDSRVCSGCRPNVRNALVQPPAVSPEFWSAKHMREALQSWHMGRVIRAYRRHPFHGQTLRQEIVANWLGLTQAQLSRIENGAPPEELSKLRHWARVLGIPAHVLWFKLPDVDAGAAARPGAQLSTVAPVPLDFGVSAAEIVNAMEAFSAQDMASRRELLAGLSILTGDVLLRPVQTWVATLPAGNASAKLGTDDVRQLEDAVKLFRRWDASGVGGLQRKAVVGQLKAMTETLAEPQAPAVRGQLFGITAELAQLSGWMAYDQGLHGVAQRYYLLALHACREAGNPELGAKVIGDMTQLSTALGHYDDSLSFARTALYSLPRQANPLVRAELLGLEARAYAHLGSREAANAARSAETCVEVYAEQPAEAQPDWIHYMNRAEVDCLAANTYIELALHHDDVTRARRYADRAEHYTVDACQRRGELYTRSRIFDEIRLAKVRLAQGEPEEAVRVGTNALQAAQSVRSSLVTTWLQRFGATLTARHPKLGVVGEFAEQLRGYLHRGAP